MSDTSVEWIQIIYKLDNPLEHYFAYSFEVLVHVFNPYNLGAVKPVKAILPV